MNGVGLARGEGADQSLSHLLRRGIHLTDRIELFEDISHHALPFVDVGQFATAEHDRDDHLVLVLQESLGLIHLELNVVLARLGAETDLFDLRVMDVGFVLFFLLLILELAEVHDSADGRFFVWRDLDKIKPRLASPGHRLIGGDDSELPTFGGDHADRGNPDLLIDAMILIDGLRLRTPTNCQAMPRDGGTVNLPRFPRPPESGRPDSRQTARPTSRPSRPHPVLSGPKFGRGATPPTSKPVKSGEPRDACATPQRNHRVGNLRVFHAVTGGVKRGQSAAGEDEDRPTRRAEPGIEYGPGDLAKTTPYQVSACPSYPT